MSFYSDESLNYLLSWVKAFDFVSGNVSLEDLCDGVLLSEILVFVCPVLFTPTWRRKIQSDGDHLSDVQRSFNLYYIVEAIETFFEEVLGQSLARAQLPHIESIVSNSDPNELLRMLQLVICCAVNGENKEECIQNILSMDQAVQVVIMESVQKIMNETSNKAGDSSHPSKSGDALLQKCHQLEKKVAELETEKITTESELEDALHRLSLLEGKSSVGGVKGDDADGSISLSVQLEQTQTKLRRAQEEIYQLETELQEAKLRQVEANKRIEELSKTNESLVAAAAGARAARDEAEVAREEAAAALRRTAALEAEARRRAEETAALRTRLTALSTEADVANRQLLALQQENRLNSSLRANAEATRNQSFEVTSRISELELRTLQLEEELKQSRADLQASLAENRTLAVEMRRLRESHASTSSTPAEIETGDCLGHIKSSLNSSARPVVPSMEGCISSDTVYEIEQRYRGYLSKALEVIRQLDRRTVAAEAAAAAAAAANRNAEQGGAGENEEISRLQSLLAEKENIIEQLERHHEQVRRQRDLEDRMVLTAWYHLGMRVNRGHAERILQGEIAAESAGDLPPQPPISFLEQQRRTHLNPPQHPRNRSASSRPAPL